MRRTLGTTLLALALLAACGDGRADGGSADDPSGPGSATPAPKVTLVSGTAAGGEPADRVTVLGDDAAISTYAGKFRGSLAGDVARAATEVDVPPGHELVAAVVAVGCDVPTEVNVTGSGDGVALTAQKGAVLNQPSKECLAAVTTVALAVVPA